MWQGGVPRSCYYRTQSRVMKGYTSHRQMSIRDGHLSWQNATDWAIVEERRKIAPRGLFEREKGTMLADESAIVIDPIVQRELQEDEQLLWWGQPNPKRHAGASARGWAIWIPLCGVILLLLLAAFFFFFPPALFKASGILPLLLVTAAVVLLFSLSKRIPRYRAARRAERTMAHTLYAVTTRRVLIIIKKGRQGVNSYSFTRAELGRIQRSERADGWGDLMFGPSRPAQGNMPSSPAARFTGIANVRQVEWLLLKTFKDGDPATG